MLRQKVRSDTGKEVAELKHAQRRYTSFNMYFFLNTNKGGYIVYHEKTSTYIVHHEKTSTYIVHHEKKLADT